MTMTAISAKHVLVADDEPDIRMFLEMMLGTNGYDVTVAEDGVKARELAQRVAPDVIILDVMMPGSDGFSVLRSLRSDPATADIPVVLLTAKTSDQDTWEGWEAGAAYYLTKPFDVDHLLDFLNSLVAGAGDEAEAAAV